MYASCSICHFKNHLHLRYRRRRYPRPMPTRPGYGKALAKMIEAKAGGKMEPFSPSSPFSIDTSCPGSSLRHTAWHQGPFISSTYRVRLALQTVLQYISFSRRSDALPDGYPYSRASETCSSIHIPLPRLDSIASADPGCKCNVIGAISVRLQSLFLLHLSIFFRLSQATYVLHVDIARAWSHGPSIEGPNSRKLL